MPKTYDATNVPTDDYTIPDGEYVLEVTKATEGQSKKGDYQVVVNFKVVSGERKGFPVTFHRVTFFAPTEKGAGVAMGFLKAIGQPYKGQIIVTPSDWIGARVLAWLEVDEYNGKKSMKVKWVKPVEADKEEVPF